MVDPSSSLHDNILLEIYLIHDVRGLYTCSGLARGIYLQCIETEPSPSKPSAQGELAIHLHTQKKKKVARTHLTFGFEITAYIPSIRHNLPQQFVVLVTC